jgi:hypothetical protein
VNFELLLPLHPGDPIQVTRAYTTESTEELFFCEGGSSIANKNFDLPVTGTFPDFRATRTDTFGFGEHTYDFEVTITGTAPSYSGNGTLTYRHLHYSGVINTGGSSTVILSAAPLDE